jgi:allantoin racemase
MDRKILLINPNTSVSMTEEIERSAEACKFPDTEIVYVNCLEGPEVIETYLDDSISAVGVLEIIKRESPNYDAFIIAASPDPGLFGARELTNRPVLGIGQSPLILASLLGRKFSIIGHWKGDKPRSEDKVDKYGFSALLCSVISLNEQPLVIHKAQEDKLLKLIQQGKKAIENDGAEVLVLTGAAFAGMQAELSAQLGVPVLEGISSAVKLAEILIDLY